MEKKFTECERGEKKFLIKSNDKTMLQFVSEKNNLIFLRTRLAYAQHNKPYMNYLAYAIYEFISHTLKSRGPIVVCASSHIRL